MAHEAFDILMVDAPIAGASDQHAPESSIQSGAQMHEMLETYRTGYMFDPLMLEHKPVGDEGNDPHPEQPIRILAVHNILRENLLEQQMLQLKSRSVERDEILLVHSSSHWDKVQALQCMCEPTPNSAL